MPLLSEYDEQGGYRVVLDSAFRDLVNSFGDVELTRVKAGLAVIYDKNPMEASGYASALSDLYDEPADTWNLLPMIRIHR